jgi:hypothetical protein
MREQRPPDLFLILGGQALHFGNGLFKCLDHDASIPNRSTQNRGSRDVGRGRQGCPVSPQAITRGDGGSA